MDALSAFLEELKKSKLVQGNLLGFFNVLIGRRITTQDGQLLTKGLAWRELAALLKKLRWDPDVVREIGLDPDALPPRDRERFWYTAITRAQVDGAEAKAAGDRFAQLLSGRGFDVGAPPRA